ncbi:MAG: DNA polymerase III subunit delta [Candidatus Paceibacterota bacterium]|nr:MAG: DNA polymerase III subunit delta [Candidatus Paceibacterota bacterium]
MIIAFFGTDSYRITRAVGDVIRAHEKKHPHHGGVLTCDFSSEEGVRLAHDALQTTSLFGGVRLVRFPPVAGKKDLVHVATKLLSDFRLSEVRDVVVIIAEQSEEAALRKEHPAYAAALKGAQLVKTFALPPAARMETWVRQECAIRGLQIGPDAARALIERRGVDPWALAHEIDKLQNYVNNSEVLRADIDALISPSVSENAFALLDDVADGRVDSALARCTRLLSGGEDPLRLLGLLAHHVRTTIIIGDLARRGSPPERIARDAGIHPFVVRKSYARATRIPQEYGARLMELLARVDRALKEGGGAGVDELARITLHAATLSPHRKRAGSFA